MSGAIKCSGVGCVVCVFAFLVFLSLLGGGFLAEVDFLPSGLLPVVFGIAVDLYGALFSFVVCLISFCVLVYSNFYMEGSSGILRFGLVVKLFVLSMLLLVLVPNFMSMMVGWDGLGLTSFLLVVFYDDKRSLGSGYITFISNRIGDGLLILALALSSFCMGWGIVDILVFSFSSAVSGLVCVASTTKSAQIPFSSWLPCAMAAPTPVSALVHSSTLVTAGGYLLIRYSSCVSSWSYSSLGCLFSLTSLISGLSACYEWDIKKVVAYSTLSQMSLVMLAISVGATDVAFFHLLCHALFKSLLFLCVGVVIFSCGVQDMRFISGVNINTPWVGAWIVCSCLSLGGFPFMAGFYSKDLVIECVLCSGGNLLGVLMSGISLVLSVVYCYYLVDCLLGEVGCAMSMSPKLVGIVSFPCGVLGLGALFGGWVLQSCVLPFNVKFSWFVLEKLFPLVGLLWGFIILVWKLGGWEILLFGSFLNVMGSSESCFFSAASKGFYLYELSGELIPRLVLKQSALLGEYVESGEVEWSVGSSGAWGLTGKMFEKVSQSYSGPAGHLLLKTVLSLMSI
uniref:NADH-ubiquinone oxidoreductase chain 5 n=1 Tax=Gari togata TaxID=2774046 RepID=A0A8K0Z4K6_9BIVA|nr:NADH dehydrogenase subunit 5 [Gari togata]